MRRWLFIFIAPCVVACAPDLDIKASRVAASRVVALRSTPAEVRPGESVTWEAILVTPLPTPPVTQIDWAFCNAPRSPSDAITVTGVCLGPVDPNNPNAVVSQVPNATGTIAQGSVPMDTCRRIGPEVPLTNDMGERQRPPDPDITGGYQLPIRLVTSNGATIDDITFDRQRVRCALASAPADAAREYQRRYQANLNPDIEALVFGNAPPAPVDGTATFGAPRGRKLPVRIQWPEAAIEKYVLFDQASRAIEERTERLEISWYTNGGAFERDRTTPDANLRTSSNVLTLDDDVTEPVTVWIILRDDRGGVGYTTMTVIPT